MSPEELPEQRSVFEVARIRKAGRYTDPGTPRGALAAAGYYWGTLAAVADENSEVATYVAHMHPAVLEHLHGEALQLERRRQRAARAQWWSDAAEAAEAAEVLYGRADRDHILAMLRAWALAEDEDRWTAQLPACDTDCDYGGGEFSQGAHRIDCARGAAWRVRYGRGGAR